MFIFYQQLAVLLYEAAEEQGTFDSEIVKKILTITKEEALAARNFGQD